MKNFLPDNKKELSYLFISLQLYIIKAFTIIYNLLISKKTFILNWYKICC